MSKVFQIRAMVEHTITIRADSEADAHRHEELMQDDDFVNVDWEPGTVEELDDSPNMKVDVDISTS